MMPVPFGMALISLLFAVILWRNSGNDSSLPHLVMKITFTIAVPAMAWVCIGLWRLGRPVPGHCVVCDCDLRGLADKSVCPGCGNFRCCPKCGYDLTGLAVDPVCPECGGTKRA